jgi:hypothetical protein
MNRKEYKELSSQVRKIGKSKIEMSNLLNSIEFGKMGVVFFIRDKNEKSDNLDFFRINFELTKVTAQLRKRLT